MLYIPKICMTVVDTRCKANKLLLKGEVKEFVDRCYDNFEVTDTYHDKKPFFVANVNADEYIRYLVLVINSFNENRQSFQVHFTDDNNFSMVERYEKEEREELDIETMDEAIMYIKKNLNITI